MTDIATSSNTKVARLTIEEIPGLLQSRFQKMICVYADAHKYSQNKDSLNSAQKVVLAEKTLEKMSFVRKNCEHLPRTEIMRITPEQVIRQHLKPVLLTIKGLKEMPYYEVLGNIQVLVGSGTIKGIADIYGVYAMTDAHESVDAGNPTPVNNLLAIGDVFKKKSSDRKSFVAFFQKKQVEGFHNFIPTQRNLEILKKGTPFVSNVSVSGNDHLPDEAPVPVADSKENLCIVAGTTILAFM